MRRTSVYASNEVYFARLHVRLCAYANARVKKEVYLGLYDPFFDTIVLKSSLIQNASLRHP